MNFQGDWYHLYSPKEDKHGVKSFEAVLDFFHYFNGIWHVDEAENKSMMIEDSIGPLFINKDYILNVIDNFYSNTMSYSKQQSSTERFLYFIGRHNAEFNIPIGTQTVQVRNRIGLQRDDIIIHEDDNLIDLSIDTDTSSFCTAIKGYYAFQSSGGEDSTEKEPTKTYDYISPMASKYGVYWGEPIYDERYRSLEGIKEACKIKQESTFKMSFTLKASLFDIALNEGDEIRLVYPSKSINMYIRVVEISEEFDEDGDLIDAEYTFGNENISAQYRKMQYDSIMDINDILLGKKPIPYSVLPASIKQATQVINDGDNTQFYYRSNEIYGVNLDNPLGVTRYNANGLGFSQDGGETYSNAITYLGVVTEALTAGTIDANRIAVYGSDAEKYMYMNGTQFISHGEFDRTWAGATDTAELNLGIYNGRIMISNEDTGYNLYMTEKGLSTTMSGAIDDYTAGTIEFHSQRYNTNSRGVTVHSTYGAVALESDYSTIYTVSNLTNNIESREYSIYLRPFRDSRNGLNEFQFYVKDNESSSDTDGALLYGNLTEGATHGSGIRLSKSSSDPKVYATNVDGDIGTGGLHGKYVQAESIRVLDEGSNLYLGTSTGEVRVTNNLLHNGGDIGYKPIKASAFTQASSETYKTNIEDFGDVGLETIRNLKVVEYDLIDDIEEGITDNRQVGLIAEDSDPVATKDLTGIDLYKMSSYSIKAIQELEERVKLLEAK